MNKEKIVWSKIDGSEIVLDKSDICPMSGKWLIPANCTEIQPPKNEKNSKIYFQKGKWKKEKVETQKEVEQAKVSEVKSFQEQIQELKDEIEQLKFEKNEISLTLNLEKEKLLNEIEITREELKNIREEIENARENIFWERTEANGFKTNS